MGDYINDTVTIGGEKITGQQLGLALDTVRPAGIMGLGFSKNVASGSQYPTIVDNMVSQGLIDTPAYSLWLVRLCRNLRRCLPLIIKAPILLTFIFAEHHRIR